VARVIAVALVAGVALNIGGATAQTAAPCGRTKVMTDVLRERGEEAVAAGLTRGGDVLTLFRTKDGEDWTLVLALPNGYACAYRTGKNWMSWTPEAWQVPTVQH
jgi:NAD(P)-dependent dehydrogenase (short-subunit alcohol dehydrogenase family)